jgi:hypothetical protein
MALFWTLFEYHYTGDDGTYYKFQDEESTTDNWFQSSKAVRMSRKIYCSIIHKNTREKFH